tara:strand:- start:1788 stop:2054 length:267 start_codon:yes stop_codon:yes gene_type:complete
MKRTKLDDIVEQWADVDILKADGFDDCVLGYDYNWDGVIRLIYSVDKIIKKLVKKDKMDIDEAIEYFEFNMRGSYVGEKTPIWCQDDF